MNYKTIFNPTIARQLLHKGHAIVDIKPKKENKKETVFVFECNKRLLEDLTTITK